MTEMMTQSQAMTASKDPITTARNRQANLADQYRSAALQAKIKELRGKKDG